MRVLIADPQPKVRHALSIWVSKQPGWEVAGEAADSSELIELLDQFSPGVVILDRDLPSLPSEELVAKVRQICKSVVIILLTASPLDRKQTGSLNVDYLVSKVDPPDRMVDAALKARNLLKNNPMA